MHIAMDKEKKKDIQMLKEQGQRITCPVCGNDEDFLEVADGVILTTRYIQNEDGSFTQDSDDSEVLGRIKFFCGECSADLTQYHQRFMEMLF